MSVSTGPDVSVPGRLAEVADGVFAYVQPDGSWMINNTGFLVARDGVTAVDACSTERRTRAFLDTVASVTRLPVRTLVNTHGPVRAGDAGCRSPVISWAPGALPTGALSPVSMLSSIVDTPSTIMTPSLTKRRLINRVNHAFS